MKTVGKQLQEARLAKNWTPEMAARETKIKVDRLRDLEVDDYSHFTSPTYARGFVRTYARALGLDEYKILRQLDNKLPDDDTPNIVTESGITYLPETAMPPLVAHRDFTGLYIVMALGLVVLLVIGFVLFQAYRVGELPGYFADGSSPDAAPKPPLTNNVPSVVDEAPPHALPVDPNDTNHAPRAEPVDINAVTADTNAAPVAPIATAAATNDGPVRALPVDPSQLSGPANAPATNVVTPQPVSPEGAPRALPVDPSELTHGTPDAAPTNSAPVPDPAAGTAQNLTPIDAKVPPRALPVDPAELSPPPVASAANSTNPASSGATVTANPPADPTSPGPTSPAPVVSSAPDNPTPVIAAAGPTTDPASPAPAPAPPDPAPVPPSGQRLVLTASQDSFVRVMGLDTTGESKALYSAVLRTGQSVGFDGRKFKIHVGLPSAVNIKLDGVNYGPHSDSEDPETFTIESHLP